MVYKSLTYTVLVSTSFASLGIATASHAQPTATSTAASISPQFSLSLSTPRNGDTENSFGQVSAFFPLFQSPGRHLTFLSTTGQADTEGNLSGSLSVGHRFALSDRTLLGTHLAYDIRDTGQNTFSQLGLGAELKGPQWETFINGYLPIGDTSAAVGDSASSSQIVDSRFENNQLLLVTGSMQTVESALGSVEIGAGTQLGNFGKYGNLWGYGRAYTVADVVGGSAQLDHRWGNRLRLGLGVQSDGVFGTQVFASVGTRLGRRQKNRTESPTDNSPGDSSPEVSIQTGLLSVWSQLAASEIQRNSGVLVRSEMRGDERTTQVAINPETDEAYQILHVTPDTATANQGDGTAENPFTTLGTGTADTDNTGLRNVVDGDLLYVQVGDSRTNAIAPFTVPANVQIHTSAAAPTLSTQLGNVTLPGDTERPLISAGGNNGITFAAGNNTVSGFEIVESDNGIYLNEPTGTVEINNNLIRNPSARAIFVEQSTGDADLTIANNQIETATTDGVRVNLTDTANLAIALTENQIDTISNADGDGIDIEVNGTSTAAISINNNQITGAGNSGIELETCGDSSAIACNANFSATVSNNTVSNSGGDGILFFHNSNQSAQLTVSDNTVQQSGIAQTGVTRNADNPLPAPGNGGYGIMAATFADGDLEIAIARNTITDTQDEKIAILNNLSTSDASALTTAAPSVVATIENNILSGSGEGIIAASDVSVVSGSVSDPAPLNETALCLQLQGNTSENGYYLSNGLVATPAAPAPAVTLARAGTFERANISDNTGTLTTSGTLTFSALPLSALGPSTITSDGSTSGTCTIP